MRKIITTIFIGLTALVGTAYAQNLGGSGALSNTNNQTMNEDYITGQKRGQTKNQIFELSDFAGGLNSKSNPISLSKNEAQISYNVRYNSELRSLTKRNPILQYGTIAGGYPITGLFRYYSYNGTKVLLASSNNKIYTGNDQTGVFTSIFTLPQPAYKQQWLTWNNQAIMVDGYNNDVKYDGTSSSATYVGSVLATDSGSGSGPGSGVYSYKVSCYTNTSGGSGPYEFAFDVASNAVTATGHAINLSMIPICSDSTFLGNQIVGRYIYRTKVGGSTYYLLTTIANQSTTTYTDSTADGSLVTVYPYLGASTTYSVPPMGKLSLVYQNRLWIANNPTYPSRVYYSQPGSHEMFLPNSYLDIRVNDGDPITMLSNFLGVLTVGKPNSIQKIRTPSVTGSPATDWSITDPFTTIGCVSMYSYQQTPAGIMYLGNNGIYNFDGNFSGLVSDPVTPVIRDISNYNYTNIWSGFYQNQYYMAYTSKESGATSNNRVLIYDLISKAFSIDTSNIGVFSTLRGGNDIEILYAGDVSNGKVYSYTSGAHDIINKTQADFSGTFTNAWYLPVEGGGDAQSALIQIANTATIGSLVGTIGSLTGTIERNTLTGTYVSPAYTVGASSLNKIYWNETLPTTGSAVTVALRSAATVDSLGNGPWSSWSSEFSNPDGSNISSVAANNVIQYRLSLTTDTYAKTPTVYSNGIFAVDLSYSTIQGNGETTIPFEWKSPWLDLGAPAYKKGLQKIYVEYESGSTGTMTINLNNYTGQSSSFSVDLQKNPNEFIAYFTNGMFIGELFNIDIVESSLNPLKIKRIVITYNIQPLV